MRVLGIFSLWKKGKKSSNYEYKRVGNEQKPLEQRITEWTPFTKYFTSLEVHHGSYKGPMVGRGLELRWGCPAQRPPRSVVLTMSHEGARGRVFPE